MKELTQEYRELFYSLYYLQNVFVQPLMGQDPYNFNGANIDDLEQGDGCFLLLKPLSSITDEDLLFCYHLHSGIIGYDYTMDFKGPLESANTWLPQGGWDDLQKYTVLADYLRSKGYALPFMGWSVEQMIEAGWIKLSEKGASSNG